MKKIWSVFLCGIIFLCLTGCGSKSDSNKTIDGSTSDETGEEERTVGIDVTDVYAISNDYAVVVAGNNVYIIDEDGKSDGVVDITYDAELDTIQVNNNGYVYFYDYSEKSHVIYDKTGEVVLKDTTTETYQYISDSNYTLRRTKSSSYESGSSYTYELVDLKGNVIKEFDDYTSIKYVYIAGNVWALQLSNNYYLYNEKTDKTNDLDYTAFKSFYDEEYPTLTTEDGGVYRLSSYGAVITSDLVYTNYATNDTPYIEYVSDKYYYNKSDYSIYDYNNKLVKDLSTGDGVTYIYSSGDKYYVKSGTGYFYIMDEDFNQEVEPYKIEDFDGSTKALGNDVIIVGKDVSFSDKGYTGTYDNYYIYDFEGNLIEDLGEGWNGVDFINPFILQVKRMSAGTSTSKVYLGPQTSDKYINLYTGKVLQVFI